MSKRLAALSSYAYLSWIGKRLFGKGKNDPVLQYSRNAIERYLFSGKFGQIKG